MAECTLTVVGGYFVNKKKETWGKDKKTGGDQHLIGYGHHLHSLYLFL